MRNLLDFLFRNVHWWLFLLLVGLSCTLIVKDNAYQRSVYLSSANGVTGKVYAISSAITSYFGLKAANEDLIQRNAELEARIQYLEVNLRETYDSVTSQSILQNTQNFSNYVFIPTHVTHNSVTRTDNYITLGKGRKDGIEPDMGVMSATGAVGVVSIVSDHFAVVIPILNSKSSLSCEVKRTNHFGPLIWDTGDPRFASLKSVPRHISFHKGDTIITSGYSAIFPKGIMIGEVVDSHKEKDDNFSTLRVALSTDFQALKEVLVIANRHKEEQQMLEGRIGK